MQVKDPSLYGKVKFAEVQLNDFYILGVKGLDESEYGHFMKVSYLSSNNAINLDNCYNEVDSLVTIDPEEEVLIFGEMKPKLFPPGE